MVSEVQPSTDQTLATQSCRRPVVTFSAWMGRPDRHNATWQEGETLMNGNRIDIDRMAWSRTREGSGSLPYSVQSDLPYGQDTDAIRLDSKFPFDDTARRV